MSAFLHRLSHVTTYRDDIKQTGTCIVSYTNGQTSSISDANQCAEIKRYITHINHNELRKQEQILNDSVGPIYVKRVF